MGDLKLLAELCAAYGPSGREGAVGALIAERLTGLVDEVRVDALGNVIARKAAEGRPKIMLAAHMDSIGLMVTFIEDGGFLRVSPIGGINPASIYGQRVVFENGTVGVVGADRIETPNTTPTLDKIYIDVGAADRAAAEKAVAIGDIAVYRSPLTAQGGIVTSSYLDNRFGCYVVIEALKRVTKPAFDIYAVFTTQEEVGCRGAKPATFAIDPDYGMAFDVTSAFDTPNARKFPMKVGAGAAVKIKDASVICDPKIVKLLTKLAEDGGVKYQYEILEGGGTDAGSMHVNGSGVPSGALSVATRYIHSANEMCSVDDIEAVVKLTALMLESDGLL